MIKPFLGTLLLLLLLTRTVCAQSGTDTIHHQKVYVVSGLGWGFAVGETSEVLQAKFSNSIGLDISLANRHYFLYPSVDFLSYRYNQQVHDPDYPYDLEKGRSNFYILNLAGGVRKQIEKLNIYAYAGPGAGVVVEPRARVSEGQKRVIVENTTHLTPTLRAGVGADYKIGNFFLFLEAGWLHNFRNIQERQVNLLSMYGGLKTDVTALKNKVASVMGIQ
ncbi:hypothetical protein GCM10011386_22410 [Parapedobacter defluvii]|uniref:Outer membrane protein beta-barrel domain-containing protein n=1 Tax=Parapedobacter defluvii TaxID=2045106 RepID=A0ABQ1LUZ2_9SPHI|nr:hypothetical protein [Parapedobacter defluvii]GGC29889.1 hypothetical protein GCM10011386_22410 [Parapedobacter defluvii]